MRVFVQSIAGKPLMPTTPRRARLWLEARRARVVSRDPFTIQLRFETAAYTQSVTVGVDTGSQTVGLAAITNGDVVYQAEVHLRTDIAGKPMQRRQYRHNRRSRKTRYRPARFANRRRPSGWLPPSLRSKAEATIKAAHFVASILPVRQLNIEIASFDFQRMQTPAIAGLEYRQGQLEGYQIREYLLRKWQRRCVYCQASGVPLQIEHIVPLTRGGSQRVSNLTLSCEPCNVRKGTLTAEEFGFSTIQAQARAPLRDAAHVSSIKTTVLKHLLEFFGAERVAVTYGYETKYKRIQVLELPKSHTNDAVAIACGIGELVKPPQLLYQFRCVSCGNYQRFNGRHSEHKTWAPRKVKGWKLYECVEAKGQRGYIAGRRLKGSFVLKDISTGKTMLEVAPSKLHRLARCTRSWIHTTSNQNEKEERTSSPARGQGYPCA